MDGSCFTSLVVVSLLQISKKLPKFLYVKRLQRKVILLIETENNCCLLFMIDNLPSFDINCQIFTVLFSIFLPLVVSDIMLNNQNNYSTFLYVYFSLIFLHNHKCSVNFTLIFGKMRDNKHKFMHGIEKLKKILKTEPKILSGQFSDK